ncbi:MAG: Nif3-like dinuclear metal center hexameric protein [Lachnospiraceae bacterium]|nr:Nif3-like dinuclear metal center hexameric protein [Lachnospiraceae bacterium]MDY5700851.1 Nif3-like dinuclear metal center hexameric protein [Lachnospiraceae bacterium]
MKCKEVMECLEKLAPGFYAEGWDNVGLLTGREDKEVEKILLALDPSASVIEQACEWGADMLITHHPLIFSPMKSVTTKDFIGKRVYRLIREDISYYAMHTNFDVMGMAEGVAEQLELEERQVLEVTFQEGISREGIGRIGNFPTAMTLKECAFYIKEKCDLPSLRVFGDPEKVIQRIALVPGSGKSYIKQAIGQGAEVFLTGDIGHHEGLDAVEQNLAVIDAGHFGLEKIFSSYMEEVLKRELPGLKIQAAREEEPFWTCI